MSTALVTASGLNFDHIPSNEIKSFGKNVISLMNTISTSTARATHYNTKEEKELAERTIHFDVFSKDRGVYAAVHCMSGVTDHSKQRAIIALLGNSWLRQPNSVIDQRTEKALIERIVRELPPNRMLNLFCEIRDQRINNSRTKRQIIPRAVLSNPNLEWWAVKYRNKLRKSLEHCWGKRMTGIIKRLLVQSSLDEKGQAILRKFLDSYSNDPQYVRDCVRFILGCSDLESVMERRDLIRAFYEARQDLSKGAKLPIEVLEGIRSTYHKDVTQKQLLDLVKDSLTTKQRRLVQRKAKKENVEVEFDPMTASPVELYIYAFEMGMTSQISRALRLKAEKVVESIPFEFNRVGILVDDSWSMFGHDTQKFRPIAITFAVRDILSKLSSDVHIQYVTGTSKSFHRPRGGTDLATGLVKLALKEPEVIFVISDGYENQPSGRVNEVLRAFERIGFNPALYHINPVVAAENKKGVRPISGKIRTIPISNPASLSSAMLIPMLESDPVRGLSAIVDNAIKLIK